MFVKRLYLVVACFFVTASLMAQTKPNDYKSNWKRIDSLLQKRGLTESALIEVNKLYTIAKNEKNHVQVIKALLYRMQLQQMKEENALERSISELEREIASSTEPSRSILTSIAAESYWLYFQRNRWKFYDRTQTTGYKKEDIATWSITDFHQRISELFLASIRNAKLLQQTRLDPFSAILVEGNTRHLRPTLFDLLAHRALSYFL